jgi:hypothetical protein
MCFWGGCSTARRGALLLVVGGALLYLSAFSPLRAWLQRLAGVAPAAPANPGQNPGQNPAAAAAGGGGGGANPNAGAGNAAAADGVQPGGGNANGGVADGGHIAPAGAGAAAGGPAAGAAGGPARRGGVLRELQALLVGFFTSLLPGAVSLHGLCAVLQLLLSAVCLLGLCAMPYRRREPCAIVNGVPC